MDNKKSKSKGNSTYGKGRHDGYNQGYQDGYNKGKEEGSKSGGNTASTLAYTSYNSPIRGVRGDIARIISRILR